MALAVSPCDDVSKEGIPAHRFAVFQYTRKYFVIIIRLEVAHDLQNFLASCIFDGVYGRYVDFYQVCYFLYSLVHPCDEPCIVVDEYEREFRMLFIEQDEAFDVIFRNAAFVDVFVVGSEAIGAVQGDVAVKRQIAHCFLHQYFGASCCDEYLDSLFAYSGKSLAGRFGNCMGMK
ncbi:unknown [Bacteroides sp. CAG:702]|nr:unknown [Bacteroides sp. CAG:702]